MKRTIGEETLAGYLLSKKKLLSTTVVKSCCAIVVERSKALAARGKADPHHGRQVVGADGVDYYFYCWKS